MFYYEEEMDRGLSKLIADTVRDLLSQYNLTVQEVIRIVANEFALVITRSLINFVEEQYDKYKNR